MMFTSMKNSQKVKQTFRWMVRLCRNLIRMVNGCEKRFFVLTPTFLRKQAIYDKVNKQIFFVSIRNWVDYSVIEQIFISHDYALEKSGRAADLLAYYHRLVSQGKKPLIIDCGGNSGMATKYFCETYREAVVVCIEPDKENIALAQLNNYKNKVHFMLAGVGNSDAVAELITTGRENWSYQVEENPAGNTQIVSINSILSNPAFENCVPFIVKIDIEGFESNLFEKNTEWIDAFPMLVIELHDWMLPRQANSQNFLKEISKRDRDFVFSGENVFSVSNTLFKASVTEREYESCS